MPTNMIIVLIGQFIKNIGGLPCAYVFMALFSDGLDHLEWKTGLRCDGVANSLNGIITVVLSGVCAGIFNALLSATGYLAPPRGRGFGYCNRAATGSPRCHHVLLRGA